MGWIDNILFAFILGAGSWWFAGNVKKIRRNILLGKDVDRSDRKAERWNMLIRVALGQSKMVVRPVAGFLHVIVYAGFVIINIEVLEILIDGLFGTHRILSFAGSLYDFLIGAFEWLAFGVIVACVVFFTRRNLVKLKRFLSSELDGWPRSDANIILGIEILLMSAFLLMNAADGLLQNMGSAHYHKAGSFPVSSMMMPVLANLSEGTLIFIERFCWWFHIIGILAFMNYLPYSKHLHILFAFPNAYYAPLEAKGKMSNMPSIQQEVLLAMDPGAASTAQVPPPGRFGAKDVQDLGQKNLLDAFSCTECGRCSAACPAQHTGKLLSPRRIMMRTRDRMEDLQAQAADQQTPDGKSLLHDYITVEELRACTTCQACVEECPVSINPLDIILQLRRYLVMEESNAPGEWTGMFGNVENNFAPWKFSPDDRDAWMRADK